jgi:cellulose synthase/poly-beta-1,6-N-acetylglucosamine synthase-like glycosyltransferase
MILLLDIVLTTVAAILAIPALILFAEIMFAFGYRRGAAQPAGLRPRVAVLMPAHDEATGIGQSLQNLRPQLLPADRLVVIADNCADDTARIAAAAGAEVTERRDPSKRGKGYALDFGVRHLEHDPPEVVIVVDADCDVSAGSIDRLARDCQARARPVQGLYLIRAAAGAGTRTRIAAFASLVKNKVRPTGLLALGLPCTLMGTGMAFPWACIRAAPLATGHIVEDMQLGFDLARRGELAHFCPDVLVTSYFPQTEEGLRSQRTRWEHGHLGIILGAAPRLLLAGLLKSDVRIMALALDQMVPPLALFVMLAALNVVLDGAFALLSGRVAPFALASVSLALVAVSVVLAWIRYGQHIVSLYALASAPLYALWKVPIYIGFLLSRQLDWVRSKRDP